MGCQQEVDRTAVFVDGPVQLAPLVAHPDVCLIDAHRAAV